MGPPWASFGPSWGFPSSSWVILGHVGLTWGSPWTQTINFHSVFKRFWLAAVRLPRQLFCCLWASLPPSWGCLGCLGLFLGPSRGHLGPCWNLLGSSLGVPEPASSHLGPSIDQIGLPWHPPWALLVPCCAILRSLGSSLGILGACLGLLGFPGSSLSLHGTPLGPSCFTCGPNCPILAFNKELLGFPGSLLRFPLGTTWSILAS